MNLLIIDDDPDLRALLTVCLGRLAGVSVQAAASGEAGLVAAMAAPPDAIILDVNMPALDGVGTLLALRMHGIRAPVVFLTAQMNNDERLCALGGAAVIHKPFRLHQLGLELMNVMGRSPAAPGNLGPTG